MRIHELVKGVRVRRKRRYGLKLRERQDEEFRERKNQRPRRKRPGKAGSRRPREPGHPEVQGRDSFKGRELCPCRTLLMGQVR